MVLENRILKGAFAVKSRPLILATVTLLSACSGLASSPSVPPSANATRQRDVFDRSYALSNNTTVPSHRVQGKADLARTWFVPFSRLKTHQLLYVTQWTYGPVLIYDLNGVKVRGSPVGKIKATASDITIDSKGNLYLSLYNQIARYAPGKSKPTLYQQDPNGTADHVAVANDGTVYMADDHNILVYKHGQTKPKYTISNPIPGGAFIGVAADTAGNVYAPDVIEGASPVYEFAPGSLQGTQLPISNDWNAVFDEIDPQDNLILSNLGVTDIGGSEPPSIQVFHSGASQPFAVFDTNNYPGRITLNRDASALFVEDVTPLEKSVIDEYAYPSGQLLETLSPKGALKLPYGLAVSPPAPL